MQTKPEFYCTKCPKPQTKDTLLKDSAKPRGVRMLCRTCAARIERERYERNPEQSKARSNRRRRKLAKKRHVADRRYEKDRDASHYVRIDPAAVRQWVEQLIQRHGGQQIVVELTGVPHRTLYALLNGERKTVDLETADAIAIEADKQIELADLIGEEGIEGWSTKGHRYCQTCGTHHHPHYGRGFCERCYYIDYHGSKILPRDVGAAWCRYAEACKRCGTTERPHRCRGVCGPCYHIIQKDGTLDRYPAMTNRLPPHRRSDRLTP